VVGGTNFVALGDYWREVPGGLQRTETGLLVYQAKDCSEPAAVSELSQRFALLAGVLPTLPDSGSSRLVTAVPLMPENEHDYNTRPHLAQILAKSLAASGVGDYRCDLVVRTNPTVRMRHVAVQQRDEVAAAAGYQAFDSLVAGNHIVLVDDVLLTATTLNVLSDCLRDAGVASVLAAVFARTRQR